ncbi:MAG: hypothetical protein MJE66_01760 [Proteobacteria bacterium]|nr:hypothetical protein [Pseudomonadota bacterium]
MSAKRAHCGHCGSANVLVQTWAFWSEKDQAWVLEGVAGDEKAVCQDCDQGKENTTIEWWVRQEEAG